MCRCMHLTGNEELHNAANLTSSDNAQYELDNLYEYSIMLYLLRKLIEPTRFQHRRRKSNNEYNIYKHARRAGSDGRMSASGSAGPGFDPRRDSKFSFENFQLRG